MQPVTAIAAQEESFDRTATAPAPEEIMRLRGEAEPRAAMTREAQARPHRSSSGTLVSSRSAPESMPLAESAHAAGPDDTKALPDAQEVRRRIHEAEPLVAMSKLQSAPIAS